jgi:hypothetical protein
VQAAKPFTISKRMVWAAYKRVKANQGAAGVDEESLADFEGKVNNLYKLWNRLASGSYFPPPVRTVLIPKRDGGQRALGMPMASAYCISSPSGLGIGLAEAISLSEIDPGPSSLRFSDTRDSPAHPGVAMRHEAPEAQTETAASSGGFTRVAGTCRRPSPAHASTGMEPAVAYTGARACARPR